MRNVYLALKKSVGLMLLLFYQMAIAQPVINSFSPTVGRVGTLVTITGTGFSPLVDSNIVYIGAVRAYVTTASTTSLTVIVPAASTYAPITVTTNRLTAYSRLAFDMTLIYGDTPFDTTSFARDNDLTGLSNPRNVVFADFNRDGRSDLFVTNQSLNTASVYRNTSSGRVVSWATPKSIGLGNEPFGIATGDLNGDGKLDVAVTNAAAGLASTVSVLRNTSIGDTIQFDITNYATGNGSIGVAIADLDADGKPDLVTTSSNSGWISVFRNTTTTFGSITFDSRVDFSTFDRADEVTIRDLDNDGKPEIVTANFLGSISVWKNLSSPGNLAFSKTNYAARQNPTGIAIGDLNGDGKPDIVLSHYGSPVLSVFRNTSSTGSISLDTRRDFPVDGNSRGISLGDLNGDGKPDVAVVSDSSDVLTLLQNASVGDSIILTNRYDFAVGAGPTGVAIGDLNADGMVDIAATNSYSKISIFRNTQSGQAPVINSFTPTIGKKGTLVTIVGSHFTGTTTVRFGNVRAGSIVYVSDTVIRAVVDTGSSGYVWVYTPAGATSKPYFTFLPDTIPPPPPIDSTSPFVTSFTPKIGTRGTVVTIFGKRLTRTTTVQFGGVPADSVIVLSDTVIKAIVDTGATGYVLVRTIYGGIAIPGFTFIRDTTPPVITSFTPTRAQKGNMVTIFGQRFTGATSVKFGGVPAKSMTVLADTIIRAFVDTGATGNVSVTTPYGTGLKAGFTFIGDTTYVPDTTGLAVTGFTPVTGRKGDVVTIFGKQLTGVNAVRFGGVLADSIIVLSDTVMKAIVGNGATGAVAVYKGLRFASRAVFIFIPDSTNFPDTTSPVISSFTPTSGRQGTIITIFGKRFTGATAVQFGGVPADSMVVLSDTVIQARVDTGATGNVRVFTPHGINSKPGFTFIRDTIPDSTAAPAIISFYPTSGRKGTMVTIFGSHFTGATAVSFGGVPADSITFKNDTVIVAIVDTGATGNVSVTTPLGTASKAGFTFIKDSTGIPDTTTLPVITNFTPTFGQKGTVVTIFGKHLTGVNQVQFGGIPADSIWHYSDTVIKARVDTGGTGAVCVFAPTGSACKAGFTFVGDSTITDTLFVNARTGINSNTALTTAKAFKMYPNPASHYVVWQQPATDHRTSLQLIDISGRIVRKMVVASNATQTTMQVGELHAGVYKLVWSDGNKKLTHTLLIQ